MPPTFIQYSNSNGPLSLILLSVTWKWLDMHVPLSSSVRARDPVSTFMCVCLYIQSYKSYIMSHMSCDPSNICFSNINICYMVDIKKNMGNFGQKKNGKRYITVQVLLLLSGLTFLHSLRSISVRYKYICAGSRPHPSLEGFRYYVRMW